MSGDWHGRVYENGTRIYPRSPDAPESFRAMLQASKGSPVRWHDEADDVPWGAPAQPDPGEAAYARCAEECRERAAGEPECTDTCRRADDARKDA